MRLAYRNADDGLQTRPGSPKRLASAQRPGPIGWGYALAWFFVNDRIKLAAYRIFDPQQLVLTTRR